MSNGARALLKWLRKGRKVTTRAPEQGITASGGGGSEKADSSEKDEKDIKALKTYARLVLNTNDADVLERAIPSFEFQRWIMAGDALFPVFTTLRARFLATDTSFRVKETVHKQLAYMKDWAGWRNEHGRWNVELKSANMFTRWCGAQFAALVRQSHQYHREFFPLWVFLTSLEEDNQDIRYESLSYEEWMARILGTYDQNGELGDRKDIFKSVVNECTALIKDGASNHVTSILSYVNRPSLLRSLIRNPSMSWAEVKDLASFIIAGDDRNVINEMSDFFCHLPNMFLTRRNDLVICEFLKSFIKFHPRRFTIPPGFDLSPLLTLVRQRNQFDRCADTLIYCLMTGGLESLSDIRPAFHLWEYCRNIGHMTMRSQNRRQFIHTISQQYYHCFTPLPSLDDSECRDLCDNMWALISQGRRNSHLEWSRIADLISMLTKDHEVELLTEISMSALLDFGWPYNPLENHSVVYLVLDFLAHIIPSLPPTFHVPDSDAKNWFEPGSGILAEPNQVPDDFELSDVLETFVRNKRLPQNWRKHSDTIIFYLDHGAFDRLEDFDDVLKFCNLCTTDSQRMKRWSGARRTSSNTRLRAEFYLKEIETRAARDRDLLGPTAGLPADEDDSSPPHVGQQRHRILNRIMRVIWPWSSDDRPEPPPVERDVELGSIAMNSPVESM
ncbi:hypothetical protein SISNIDRAFT_467553 [Sistotremastrum niveocremeum HHB9708]|uniref:Uncharacterized protein n=1 Tax=Sistotremastrum niveocremeum HHB9708 TaxID=1314777 RepID=A0A164SM77_9AGAM|nr:hypothetical protein SISNIDRAFT_467553 [Sistotremastrum niveocremeum HHB9708]